MEPPTEMAYFYLVSVSLVFVGSAAARGDASSPVVVPWLSSDDQVFAEIRAYTRQLKNICPGNETAQFCSCEFGTR